MLPDANIVKRLVFISYMFKKAVDMSKNSYPDSQMAVLMFHDSVELFLYLTCEYLIGVPKAGYGFMDYFKQIENSDRKIKLYQQIQMDKLNKSRVELKHRGVQIDDSTIEEFRVNVKNFFEENTRLVFSLEFNELSLIDLVKNVSVRDCLKKAHKYKEEGSNINSLINSAKAFDILLESYGHRKFEEIGTPHGFNSSIERISNFNIHKKPVEGFDTLTLFIDEIKSTIELMGNSLHVISLGINYRKYSRFRTFTPQLVKENEKDRAYFNLPNIDDIDKEDVKFCLDFVIESAISIQEFDYDTSKIWKAYENNLD